MKNHHRRSVFGWFFICYFCESRKGLIQYGKDTHTEWAVQLLKNVRGRGLHRACNLSNQMNFNSIKEANTSNKLKEIRYALECWFCGNMFSLPLSLFFFLIASQSIYHNLTNFTWRTILTQRFLYMTNKILNGSKILRCTHSSYEIYTREFHL